MKKKMISALLCVSMAAGILSGCGGGTEPAQTQARDTKVLETTEAAAETEKAEETQAKASETTGAVTEKTTERRQKKKVRAGMQMRETLAENSWYGSIRRSLRHL